MQELDKETVTKLNAEINQYLNHQYTLYISAVTLLGVVMAWVSQRVSAADPTSADIGYMGFAAVSLFLVLIAVLEARLTVAISICGTYLRMRGAMAWERDIEKFRQATGNRIGLTSRGTFFIAVGIFALLWPLLLAWIAFQNIVVTQFLLAHLMLSTFYFVAVFLLLPWGIRLRQSEIENAWGKVTSEYQASPAPSSKRRP